MATAILTEADFDFTDLLDGMDPTDPMNAAALFLIGEGIEDPLTRGLFFHRVVVPACGDISVLALNVRNSAVAESNRASGVPYGTLSSLFGLSKSMIQQVCQRWRRTAVAKGNGR